MKTKGTIMKHTLAGIIAPIGLTFSLFAVTHAAERPNILWLITEDLGQHLGCYGANQVWTPDLDQMASRGVRFPRFLMATSARPAAQRSTPACMPPPSVHTTIALRTELVFKQKHK
jgi:hypothetical protein